MKIRISPQQIQKHVLAPSMQQSIEMLILPLAELSMAIDQELQNNPLLEIEEKDPKEQEYLDQLLYHNTNYDTPLSRTAANDLYNDDDSFEERPITRSTPLEDYLLQQLRIETTDPLELKIGEYIIGQLNEDGYLTVTCEEIAQSLGLEDVKTIEQVLHTIQNFEPVGIASRDLKECLIIQAHFLFNGRGQQLIHLIREHLENLGRKKFSMIARDLKISIDEVRLLAKLVSKLEPKPARNHRPLAANTYVKPDVFVTKNDEDSFQVQINQDVPRLRINPVYQNMLKQPNRTDEEIQFIREKIKSGVLFIRSIEQRHQTLREIAEYILRTQKDFFDQGAMAIKPMILKNVAEAINRNESTVSRAINNKYMQTPQGLFPMKFFFSQAVTQTSSQELVSSRSLKEGLQQMIDQEDKSKPLSDQELQQAFADRGMNVARRTITKYRQNLRILPSHLRKS